MHEKHQKECSASIERHSSKVADAVEALKTAQVELVQADAVFASRRRQLVKTSEDVVAIDGDIKAAQAKLTKELEKGRETAAVLAKNKDSHKMTLSMVKELSKRVAAEIPSGSGVSTALLEIGGRIQHKAMRASVQRAAAASRVSPKELHSLLARLQIHMVDSVESRDRDLERQQTELEELKANTKKRVTALARRRLELTEELHSMRRLVDQRRTLRDRAHAAVEAKEVELQDAKKSLHTTREGCATKSQHHRDTIDRHGKDIEMVHALKAMIGGNVKNVKEIYNSYTGSTGATGATGGAATNDEGEGPADSAFGVVSN